MSFEDDDDDDRPRPPPPAKSVGRREMTTTISTTGPRGATRGFRCPFCRADDPPVVREKVSAAGWIVLVVLIFFCFPLFWIGLLMKENYRECQRLRHEDRLTERGAAMTRAPRATHKFRVLFPVHAEGVGERVEDQTRRRGFRSCSPHSPCSNSNAAMPATNRSMTVGMSMIAGTGPQGLAAATAT